MTFMLLCSMPLSVWANAPAPADFLTVAVSDKPQEAIYADLLIKIDAEDANYTDFQPNTFADDKATVQELVDYAEDGYRSFTFHYQNARSNIKLEQYYDGFYSVEFGYGSELQNAYTQYEDLLHNYQDIKIVLLDQDFHILSVSESAKLPQEKPFVSFYGEVVYHAADGSFTVESGVNPYSVLSAVLFSGVFILLSVGAELLVALLFRFRGKQLLPILLVNIASQIAMRTLYLVLPLTYLVKTIVLELLVYSIEFVIYQRRLKQTTMGKILWYTIAANTVSLLLGIVLNRLL